MSQPLQSVSRFANAFARAAGAALLVVLAGAANAQAESQKAPGATAVTGDSLVLAGSEPGALVYGNVDPSTVTLRSTYVPGEKTVVYKAGRDYVLDAKAGTIARTNESRIPDFATNVLYGKKDFNHGAFPGYGNGPFFVFADYTSPDVAPLIRPTDVGVLLPKTTAKLKSGGPLKIIAYGDSITAGGEATSVDLQYGPRWAASLRKRFPMSQITFENGATGGDTSENGIARLEEKVLSRKPDLVLVAFGMNDHNLGGVPIPKFRENLRSIVSQIREKTGAEVILLSTFPPHPDWHFGSHQMEKYAAATQETANELNTPYADVYGIWQGALKRKDPSSLLGNNINHPNDFGHWLWLQALESLQF